jgi:hypothetical protein
MFKIVKLCQLKQDSFLGDKPLHSSLRPLFNPGFGRTTVPSDPCRDNAPPYRGRSLTVRAPFTLNVFPTSYRQDYFNSTSMRTRIPLPPEDGSPLRVNLWLCILSRDDSNWPIRMAHDLFTHAAKQ